MSCSTCNYITGHDADCPRGHEDLQRESAEHQRAQDELRARLDDLETRISHVETIVLDHKHLRKLYDESRAYVRALERERADLVEAARKSTAEQDRLDALIARLRPVYEAAKVVRAHLPAAADKLPGVTELIGAIERAIEADFAEAFE